METNLKWVCPKCQGNGWYVGSSGIIQVMCTCIPNPIRDATLEERKQCHPPCASCQHDHDVEGWDVCTNPKSPFYQKVLGDHEEMYCFFWELRTKTTSAQEDS